VERRKIARTEGSSDRIRIDHSFSASNDICLFGESLVPDEAFFTQSWNLSSSSGRNQNAAASQASIPWSMNSDIINDFAELDGLLRRLPV
jgi:hypothetical protein